MDAGTVHPSAAYPSSHPRWTAKQPKEEGSRSHKWTPGEASREDSDWLLPATESIESARRQKPAPDKVQRPWPLASRSSTSKCSSGSCTQSKHPERLPNSGLRWLDV